MRASRTSRWLFSPVLLFRAIAVFSRPLISVFLAIATPGLYRLGVGSFSSAGVHLARPIGAI